MRNTVLSNLIPPPFKEEAFQTLKTGIYDDDTIQVLMNQRMDFALLWPQPAVDYGQYRPRTAKLRLDSYKAASGIDERRALKILPYVPEIGAILEIGAGNGAFLRLLSKRRPSIKLAACDPDSNTKDIRRQIVGDDDYESLEKVLDMGKRFDIVCMFHVLEHVLHPAGFLEKVRGLIHPSAFLIIEVPSLTDPLRSLYRIPDFEAFYFQKQHPYIYSHTSLTRLMEYNSFKTTEVIPFQRYGIENHLQWIRHGKPGGNEEFRKVFKETEKSYLFDLESCGLTDSVIWIGTGASEND